MCILPSYGFLINPKGKLLRPGVRPGHLSKLEWLSDFFPVLQLLDHVKYVLSVYIIV